MNDRSGRCRRPTRPRSCGPPGPAPSDDGVGAVGPVHADAAAAGDEADDLVAGHRACSSATAAPSRRRGPRRGRRPCRLRLALAPRRARRVAGSCSSSSPLRSARAMPLGDRLARHVVLADGHVAARRGRRSSGPRPPWPARREPSIFCTGQALAAQLARSAPPARPPWRPPGAPGENHWRILLRARGLLRRSSASRGCGPAPSTLEVKISQVSPDCSVWSSGTSRPFTRAPMQAWPTSVWTE